MTIEAIIARTATFLLAVLICFQLALSAGMPLGPGGRKNARRLALLRFPVAEAPEHAEDKETQL